MIALLDEYPKMTALAQAILRLLLPLIRDWWKKKNWSAHSIKNLKEIHYIFFGGLFQFALLLVVVDHGLGLYIAYTDVVHDNAIESSRVEHTKLENTRLISQNQTLTEQVDAANRLIRQLIENNPSLAPKKTVTNNPSVPLSDKLNGLKKKYGEP